MYTTGATYYSDLSLVHQPHFASTGCNYYFFSFISHNLSQRQIVSKKVKKKKNWINGIYIFHKKIEPLVNEETKDKAIVKFWWTKSENYILPKSVFCNHYLHYIEQDLLCSWVKTEGFQFLSLLLRISDLTSGSFMTETKIKW